MRKLLMVLATTVMALLSGCATVFVRSDSCVPAEHVYPATAFDAEMFWSGGIKGEPPLAMADPNFKNGVAERFVYGTGALIDLPFSIVFDTLLLPVDVIRLLRPRAAENDGREQQGGGYSPPAARPSKPPP